MLRVMSSSVWASRTTNATPSRTNRRTSSSVMYLLRAVSYRRRLGYFLMMRGSLMVPQGATLGMAPSRPSYHVFAAVAGHVGPDLGLVPDCLGTASTMPVAIYPCDGRSR